MKVLTITVTLPISAALLGFVVKLTLLFALWGTDVHAEIENPFAQAAIQAVIDEDLRTATDKVKAAIARTPDDSWVHKLAGDIFVNRARRANLLSAASLARKALKSYKKAVELSPDNAAYRLNLMQFYLIAPGIVGGSKKLGAEQMPKIKALDPVKGVVAESLLYRTQNDLAARKAIFSTISPELAEQPQVKLELASYLAASQQEVRALRLYDELADLQGSHSLSGDDQLVPYRAMFMVGFLGLENENYLPQGVAALKRYLEQAPGMYRLAPKNWARYFLGQSYQKMGEIELAKQSFEQAKRDTKDKALIKEVKKALKNL